MLHTLEPHYKIPQRVHIVDTAVPKMYDQVKKAVKTLLNAAQRVALTCDGWTSRATESYITITSRHISDDWEMVTHVLQTRAMHESHTGSNIADLLKRAIDEWGLQDKDPVIVTDNASNMSIAAELAGMMHFKCFAHTLNLASQRALKLPAVQRLLGRVRRVTSFFRRSVIASHVLKEKQKLLNLQQHKLQTDVTRWNSAHDMLQRFLEQQPAITAALLSNEVRKNEKDISILNEGDITAAEEVVHAMKPMKIATVDMEEEKTPTLSAVAPVHAQLIQKLQESPSDSNMTKEIKSAICQDLKKRYLDEQRETLHVCAALDPRFKALPFLSEDERQAVYDRVIAETARIKELFQQRGAEEDEAGKAETQADGEEEDENAGPEVLDVKDEGISQDPEEEERFAAMSTSKKTSRDSCGLADLLGQTYASGAAKKLKTPENQAQEEMARFKDTAPMPVIKGSNPLKWWKERECEFPLLSNLAKRYLCVPGTSVSSKRVFSLLRGTLSPHRGVYLLLITLIRFFFYTKI